MRKDTVDEGGSCLYNYVISHELMFWRNNHVLSDMKWLKISVII